MPSKLPFGVRYFGTQRVVIVHNEGTDDEQRHDARAQITRASGLFPLDTPIVEGDVVEFVADHKQGVTRKVALAVNGDSDLLEVSFGRAPALRVAAVRRLGIQGLHPAVIDAANALFTDGHYSQAIFEAFKALELRVKQQSGLTSFGQRLMEAAFTGDPPPINLGVETGQSARSEQAGFRQIFVGAFQGIRNPKGHEIIDQDDPQRTLEYLAMVSILFRRLDDATAPRNEIVGP